MSPSSEREVGSRPGDHQMPSSPQISSCTLPTPAPARRHGPGVRLGVKRAGGGSGAGAGGASSFQDDFQVISQNHLLASINMRHAHYPAPRHQVPRPGPGCGYTECAHCDTPPAPPPARSLRQPPPPLPPKPPWLRPALVGSAVPRSRPASYNENISSPAASFNESSSETTETSCSTEQETVIYSRSVRLGSGAGAHSEVNLRLAPDKNSAASSSTPSHRKKVGVYGQKSATMDLQALMVERFVREKLGRRALLSERLGLVNRNIATIATRLAATATPRESEKFNLYVQDTEKVTCLMHSLACRLAKTENILETFGLADKQLENKRDKLKSQLEESKYLSSLVHNRDDKISMILEKYLGNMIMENFKERLEEKLKIIVELKELDDQVCLSSA